MGKIDNEILSEISKNVAIATYFQYLVPLKNRKQSKRFINDSYFDTAESGLWQTHFVVIMIIVTTAITLSKTRDCGFLLKKPMSINSFVSYKFVLDRFIHVPASLLICNWLSK